MRGIKVLPESVRNSLRSGIILSDLTRVVEELVFNSLDAGATKVIVAVGIGTNYIKVTDNGCGITRDGLVLVGERYATSKFEQLAGINTVPESFGFRGEALSSISDVSLLQVVTKAHGMPNGYCKVIKCSKCLYLGIDDDRQDVGTTVVVRDLFYNQPVRRRHIQSSPKKVLHAVKECILRIALVHLGTSFKVIDIESGDELLCLYPTSSPLPLLMSAFGTEVSSSLHKLDTSDGKLKLSGFISGPCETFSVKAFQYLYINSRYISRGPIHKLLNQLATEHNSSDLLKGDIRSQCGKRNRCQSSLTYIMNLSCPRAHYDLSFEPSKTCAAFKDWDPVFTFIKKAVSCLWSQGAHMSEEDDIWNGADTLSTRDGPLIDCGVPKKRCMTRPYQASIVLASPQLEMPREEPKHMPYNGYSRNPFQRKAVQSQDYGSLMDFACFPDNLLNFSSGSLPKCKSPIPQVRSNPKFSMEPSSIHMDHFPDAKWNTNDRVVVKESSAIPFDYDNGKNIDDDLMKPFLRSCSSRMELSPVVRSTRHDDQIRFQDHGYRKWLHLDDRVDNRESDNIIQGSEPWLDDNETAWSPPKIDDASFLSKESFDSLLTDGNRFMENSSPWFSPIASNQHSKSSHRSLKYDWSAFICDEKPEPRIDIHKRDFKLRRDDWFDLFADEEGKKGIFDFDNMRYNSQQECELLNETDWTGSESRGKHETDSRHVSSLSCADVGMSEVTQSRFQDKQPRRSRSAPPTYRGKKKFVALNSIKLGKTQYETLHSAPVEEASLMKHVQKSSPVDLLSSEEGPAIDLEFKARHNKKEIIDKAEISDYEGEEAHFLDVYNTDSDFTPKDNQGALDYREKWRSGYPCSSSIQKSDNVIHEDSILDISSGILHLSGESLLPKSISKKCLEDAKVLQQVDKKFIPIVGDGILAIIDQHAADERIRLEDLRNKVLSGKMKTINYLDAEQELALPEIGYQLLKTYSEQIKKWGWICNFDSQSSVSFKKNLNFLHNQPSVATLIAVPCILGVNLSDVDLLEFLKQLADTDGSSPIPPAVLRLLNSKACRGSIMFGDALLPSECSLIVEELKQTSLCFQCAHGRPTTVPLVNLAVLHKQIAKLGNRNRGSSESWHGLSRHRPSLERAAQRLGKC